MKKLWQTLAWALIAGIALTTTTTFAQATQAKQKQEKQEKEQDQEPELSVDELMQEAQGAFRRGEMDEAIEMIYKAHEAYPDDIRVSLTYLSATQQQASQLSQNERVDGNDYYYKSAKVAREIMNRDDLPEGAESLIATCIYNEACSLGVDGKKDEAVKVLKEAFEYGFDKYDLAREDSDFGDLLETDEYQKLVDDAEKSKNTGKLKRLMAQMKDFEPFEFDFVIDTMDADELTLESLRGKIVIVDLWSTSAPGSRKETRALVKLKTEHEDKLEIVGMAFERGDDDEAYDAVEKYISRNDINYPCSLGDEDIRDQLPDFEQYPTKVFIDAEGTVRFVKAGESTFEELETIVKSIAETDE
jgi:thiol-disulfide isomerase/thioredoxin